MQCAITSIRLIFHCYPPRFWLHIKFNTPVDQHPEYLWKTQDWLCRGGTPAEKKIASVYDQPEQLKEIVNVANEPRASYDFPLRSERLEIRILVRCVLCNDYLIDPYISASWAAVVNTSRPHVSPLLSFQLRIFACPLFNAQSTRQKHKAERQVISKSLNDDSKWTRRLMISRLTSCCSTKSSVSRFLLNLLGGNGLCQSRNYWYLLSGISCGHVISFRHVSGQAFHFPGVSLMQVKQGGVATVPAAARGERSCQRRQGDPR